MAGASSRELVGELDDAELRRAIRDLGGHDLVDLLDAFRAGRCRHDRPSVVFAYTIKARGLATEGHPANHSALLSVAEWEELAAALGADASRPLGALSRGSPEAALCAATAARLQRDPVPTTQPAGCPGRRRS